MAEKHRHEPRPMPHTEARHLLNPLRKLFLSPKKLVRRLELKPDSMVLELGPGPGYFSPETARSLPEGKLVLVDIQQEMLDMARERLTRLGLGNVVYLRGDAASLPAEDESFDVVFLVAVLGEVPDQQACLREIRRVLRPDGMVSFTEQKLGDPHFISPDEMLKTAEAAGFRLCARYGPSFNYTVNFRKSPLP